MEHLSINIQGTLSFKVASKSSRANPDGHCNVHVCIYIYVYIYILNKNPFTADVYFIHIPPQCNSDACQTNITKSWPTYLPRSKEHVHHPFFVATWSIQNLIFGTHQSPKQILAWLRASRKRTWGSTNFLRASVQTHKNRFPITFVCFYVFCVGGLAGGSLSILPVLPNPPILNLHMAPVGLGGSPHRSWHCCRRRGSESLGRPRSWRLLLAQPGADSLTCGYSQHPSCFWISPKSSRFGFGSLFFDS